LEVTADVRSCHGLDERDQRAIRLLVCGVDHRKHVPFVERAWRGLSGGRVAPGDELHPVSLMGSSGFRR
jgi:hypothetical protein